MDEPQPPPSADDMRERFILLRNKRRQRHAENRAAPRQRRSLRAADRQAILAKTDGRCHICGGRVVVEWEADHVLAHAGGGPHSVENYLAAHSLCNNYRWDYDAEEFQWVLKIGVWARLQMEKEGVFGAELLARFFRHESLRLARRKRALKATV